MPNPVNDSTKTVSRAEADYLHFFGKLKNLDMESNFATIVAASVIFTVIACISLALRFWTRHVTSAGYAADDWLAVASFGFSVALAVTNALGIPLENVGTASESSDMTTKNPAVVYLKVFFVAQFWFVAAVAATKLSILYLLKRVFSSSQTPSSIWIMIWLTIGWAISFLTATFFQILPTSSGGGGGGGGAQKASPNYPWMYLISAITDLVLDIAILCLPIMFVRRLQMPLTKKICVGGIFSLGVFCIIASTTRLYYTWTCINMDINADVASNFNTSANNLLMWSAIEACISVICVNLPTFGAIFSAVQQRLSKHYSTPSNSDHDSIIEDANLDLSERSWYGTPEMRPGSGISWRRSKRSSCDVRSLSLHPASQPEKVHFWKHLLKRPTSFAERRMSALTSLKGLRYSRTISPRDADCGARVPVSPVVEMSVVRTGSVDDDAEFRILPCSPVEAAVRMS